MKLNIIFHLFSRNIQLGTLAILFMVSSCKQEKEKNVAEEKILNTPNIIYIMADDLTIQAISAYGGLFQELAPTPNIDRLAKEGMLFNNVMCTNAICGPSRAAILTGNYSNVNGYYKNESGGQFDASEWTFPQEFQNNGYRTALFGKWHLGSEPKGFDTFAYHILANQQGHYWNPTYNVDGTETDFEGYATNLSTNFALDWLSETKKDSLPFLMVLQYKAPHRPWEPDTKYETLWDDIEMPYPATFNDDYKGRELTAGDTEMTMDFLSRRDMKLETPLGLEGREKVAWEFFGARRDQIVEPQGMTAEDGKKWRYQRYIKDYLACVKSVDDNIGRVLDYLEAEGLSDNTAIILTSDQGFYLGEHGFFDKRFIYEESLKMPFMVKYPRVVSPGSINNDIISNVDFAPTLLDLAGIKTKTKMQGRSFIKNLMGNTPGGWRNSMYYHYYEFPYWHHVQPHYGIRTTKYTLAHFYYNIDVWELYDLEKDPQQMNNVIHDPTYAEVVTGLKEELKVLMKEYGDDKPLEIFRAITDKDFGAISERQDDGISVESVIVNEED